MSFIYSVIVGVVFGLIGVPILVSILSILVLISFRSIKEIIFKKDFITGVESAYPLYLTNLKQASKTTENAALKYYLQSLLFDSLIAFIGFAITKFIV